MSELLYSKSHVYVTQKDDCFLIGVSKYLLEWLKDIKTINLPKENLFYTKGEIFGFIESEDFAIDLFMPITCNIVEVNNSIIQNPKEIYEKDNWLIKVKSEFFEENKSDLMNEEMYKKENKIPPFFR